MFWFLAGLVIGRNTGGYYESEGIEKPKHIRKVFLDKGPMYYRNRPPLQIKFRRKML